MRRALKQLSVMALAALAASIPAVAQWVPPASVGPPAPAAAVPSMAGINLNNQGYGVMVAGVPWMRFSNQTTGISSVILGRYAGLNSADGQGVIAIGEWAMATDPSGQNESVVISPWGFPYATMHNVTAVGEHTGGAETSPVACTVMGTDVLRDTVGCNGGSVFGSGAVIDGNYVDDTVIGSNNLHGTTANVVIGPGTPNAGDIITVNLTTNDPVNNTGFPKTITYTVVSGDNTTLKLAQSVHAAIDAALAGGAIQYTKPAIPGVPVRAKGSLVTATGDTGDGLGNQFISFHADGTQTTGMQLVVAASCSGACPNAVSATGASAPAHNTLVGTSILSSVGLSDPQYNTLVGHNVAKTGTSLDFNTVVGARAGLTMSTDLNNVLVGYQAGQVQTAATGNTLIGFNSGNKLTSGGSNLCLGASSCTGNLTTGSNNIVLTTAASQGDVDTAARTNLINIGGVKRWTNVSLSPPTLTCGTSPSVDANANMASGTVTVGSGTPATCTITFATAYRVYNHCRVTSQAVNASFAYSYTLASLVVTGTGLTGKIDYDCDGN